MPSTRNLANVRNDTSFLWGTCEEKLNLLPRGWELAPSTSKQSCYSLGAPSPSVAGCLTLRDFIPPGTVHLRADTWVRPSGSARTLQQMQRGEREGGEMTVMNFQSQRWCLCIQWPAVDFSALDWSSDFRIHYGASSSRGASRCCCSVRSRTDRTTAVTDEQRAVESRHVVLYSDRTGCFTLKKYFYCCAEMAQTVGCAFLCHLIISS